MIRELLTQTFPPGQALALVIVLGTLAMGASIAIVSILVGGWRQMRLDRLHIDLKHQMLGRGMSAEEMGQVLAAGGGPQRVAGAQSLPLACEAVVESGGDWYPALILEVADGRYHIHYVGHDMDENEWVSEDRVRLPAGSPVTEFTAALAGSRWPVNGKPPREVEV